jgi:ABC-type antimicrobial peptide transport system ATPase subunit
VKQRVFTILALTFTQILVMPSSNAIFGLSVCEKIKKEILIEESIGKKAWQNYDTQRDDYVRSGAMSAQQLFNLFDKLSLVYNSDLIVFNKLDKNPKCTTAANSADVRAKIQETKKEIKTFTDVTKIYEKLSLAQKQQMIIPKSLINALRTTYESYGSIYGDSK